MKRSPSWSIAVVLVLCVTSAVSGQQEDESRHLPNFQPVNANLYRGGQPTKEGIKKLTELGIKTVINLRADDEKAHEEGVEAQSVGLRYFNIPLPTFGRPSHSMVDRILKLITDEENQPVFVHCKRGSDRTGLVIAIYRISSDGWIGEEAIAEAKRYGLGFWQRRMKDYIGDYYRRRKN
jgi:protein tyrosine/serine phosphatase